MSYQPQFLTLSLLILRLSLVEKSTILIFETTHGFTWYSRHANAKVFGFIGYPRIPEIQLGVRKKDGKYCGES